MYTIHCCSCENLKSNIEKKKGGRTNIKKKKNGIHLNKMEKINNLQIIIDIEGLYKCPTG